MAINSITKAVRSLSVGVAVLSALSGCDISEDKFIFQGGISPDPTAILEGSILYIGPRPTCLYNNGAFERVLGNVVLTMFAYDNPPPPEGTASSALNLYVVSGDDIFQQGDCLPAGEAPKYNERITRSVAFRWPGLPLYQGRAADYQVRGFFDYDEDMVPLFSVTRLPTQGDIAGAAVNDIQDASKGFFRIQLPRLEDAKDGIVKKGLTIALGSPVWTERPAFRLDDNHRLPSNAAFRPKIADFATLTPDGPGSLRDFRLLTCPSGATHGASCGLTLQRLGADDVQKMSAVGVDVQLANNPTGGYAFYTAPVDIKTVLKKPEGSTSPSEGLDMAGADGKVDPHPFLGSGLGVPWFYPIVIMQRQAEVGYADIERAARIPAVLLVGSVLLGDDKLPTKDNYAESGAPVAVPPVAAVELIPGRAECRVPYFPPGTLGLVTNGRLGNCAELPTGHYAANVLGGIAGGVPAASVDPTRSETGISITGGRYSSQSWSIPNELGDPAQVPATSLMPDQGIGGTFVIHDPTPGTADECAASTPNGLCAGGTELSENAEGVDSTACVIKDCCTYVEHLCGRPVCTPVASGNDGNIAPSPRAITGTAANGGGIPDCVPFELPWQCCRAAP
ncbi:MAG: hypothetical protein RLZZ450_786 [Pseudomonadota bacterium]|jgi:hypothetical protein